MEGPPLGPGGEDITWPDQVAPRGRKASSTRKIKPQTSNLRISVHDLSKKMLLFIWSFRCAVTSFRRIATPDVVGGLSAQPVPDP